MDFHEWYNNLPKFTKNYLIGALATTFIGTYMPQLPLISWIYFDVDKVLGLQVKFIFKKYKDLENIYKLFNYWKIFYAISIFHFNDVFIYIIKIVLNH